MSRNASVYEVDSVFDAHVHLRQGDTLGIVAPYTDAVCDACIVMPNTKPPISFADLLYGYRQEIIPHLPNCTPYFLAKLLPTTTVKDVKNLHKAGAKGFKVYPEGVTTNSHDGVPMNLLYSALEQQHWNRLPVGVNKQFMDVIAEIENLGMILSFHGEICGFPKDEILEREHNFMDVLPSFLQVFPNLKIIAEHISTAKAVDTIKSCHRWAPGRIAATITPHHACNSLNDLLAGKLRPNFYCMPVVKYQKDVARIREAVVSCLPCFFFGSDTAPHEVKDKECAEGCAGIFNAPTAVETFWEIFAEDDDEYYAINNFNNFMSRFGRQFYNIGDANSRLTIKQETWEVPDLIANLYRPYRSGEKLYWKAAKI